MAKKNMYRCSFWEPVLKQENIHICGYHTAREVDYPDIDFKTM